MHAEYLTLNRAGIACMVFDNVTFGKSVANPKKRSYITDFKHLSDDVHTFCEVSSWPKIPQPLCKMAFVQHNPTQDASLSEAAGQDIYIYIPVLRSSHSRFQSSFAHHSFPHQARMG